ncbi:hypothetical protein F4825DRAFT_444096 [Nemania diffusa]|nr:hypothetical protein F4825DRAFT_444096 [Nemania diffusa]
MSALPDRTTPAGNSSGNNPDYYNGPAELPSAPVELAGDNVPHPRPAHPLQSHPVGAGAGAGVSPVTHELPGNQDYFPPPPPGPPPIVSPLSQTGHEKDQEQPYFPPPPPGPPPPTASQYGYGQQQYYPPPPPGPPPGFAADAPPPSYADEFGAGAGVPDPDAKTHIPPPSNLPGAPPALPPRPVSAGMAFAPPPTSGLPDGGDASASGGGGSAGSGGRGGFGEKLYRWGIKAGAPVNRLANRLGAEAFWPMTLDLECEKAARILNGFCKDGFYTTTPNTNNARPPSSSSPKPPKSPSSPPSHSKVLVKIPPSVLASAKGLAIFTTFRTGLHVSGAGGSGVVVARLPDGSWSPPAGFLVHTLGAGLVLGIDVYDCVCVLTTKKAVDAFASRARFSLGGEIAVVAGPVGVGGALEGFVGAGKDAGNGKGRGNGSGNSGSGSTSGNAPSGRASPSGENKPVWSYMKSRGFYAGVQADGTVIIPRVDANAEFYGERGITVERILKGQVKTHPVAAGGKGKGKDGEVAMWPEGGRALSEVLKHVDGKRADEHVLRGLAHAPSPGDLAPPPGGGKA